ncbi:MAG: molybdopterin biosynthesis protein [Thermoplasmata archaeon]
MKVFHQLVDPAVARKMIKEEISRLIRSEARPISESCGFISNESVFSKRDVPPFDRSEVDGYAVYHRSLEGAEEDCPVELEIIGEVRVGVKPELEIKEGKAAYISTGAMIPRGADSVVMVEDTRREGKRVYVYRSVRPGENIAHSGSDFFTGEVLCARGSMISPESISLLASSGIQQISVAAKLKVGIFSTGNEVVEPGSELKEGMVYDSNSYLFKASLDSTGLTNSTLLGILPDDEEEMTRRISTYIGNYDMVISSGSTSAGFHDLLYRVVEKLGGELRFHGIAMKPGKPTFLASFSKAIFLGMPGFPLSSASVLRYIVIPALMGAYGLKDSSERYVKIPFRMNTERGKVTVIPAIIGRNGTAYPVYGESGSISRLYYADGFIVLGTRKTFYDYGERVKFFELRKEKRDVLFIGSNDPLTERILYEVSKVPKIINSGSWGGLEAMDLGEADVSGIHILKDGKYNRFVLDERKNRTYYLVRGFSRSQGIVSLEGVSSFSEIVHRDLLFVNRNKGSGTRDLIDLEITRELGEGFEKESIRGYLWEAKSHAAVANAVAQRRADAGVSIEFYAKKLGLKFYKIRDEEYDLLVDRKFIATNAGKKLMSSLRSAAKYKEEFPGYYIPTDCGEIIG